MPLIDGINYSFSGSKATVVALSSGKYEGDINIPSSVSYEGSEYSITNLGNACFGYCTSLTSITIPNSVTNLGHGCFGYCTSLTNITIPDSVTSIEYSCFQNCTSLTSITIPNSVTSIGNSCFGYCTSLTSITIPDSITSIKYYCFESCTSLTNITIPDSITSIGTSCFQNCTNLIWIKLLCDESLATDSTGNYIKDGRHKEIYNNEIYYVKNDYSMQGLIPKTPINIQYSLENKKINDTQNISWNSNGNPLSTQYDLYFYQNEQWVAINSGVNLNYTHTIPTMNNDSNCKYRVRACLNGLYSEWCEGGVFSVKSDINNRYIQINGKDSYLGEKLNKFSISYSIKINEKGD